MEIIIHKEGLSWIHGAVNLMQPEIDTEIELYSGHRAHLHQHNLKINFQTGSK
ncbi:hypothetical protein WN55_06002 [Dufourea novaeangliae]|uniref:Uncharacterized protein n=1 Tax=Dufourea novaeangliae TaxID=178035 RepID=A0A154NZ82_DUFNO|nr:hypothetical protein WN55_06002 [Dufourea novaeangliae]